MRMRKMIEDIRAVIDDLKHVAIMTVYGAGVLFILYIMIQILYSLTRLIG